MKKTISFISIMAVLLAFTVSPAIASVEFDGMTWYHSHTDPNYNISVNDDGHLVWIPKNDHQIIVRIPDQDLSDTGDVVEISYFWLSDGQGNIEGCIDCCQCEDTCKKNKDITCLSGTGDFRVGLFESDGEYVTSDGMGLKNSIFAGYKGYKFCTQPHVDIEPVRWQEASGEPHIAGGFYQRDEVDNPRLLSVNSAYNRISMYGGFELPLDTWSLWIIRLERLSASSVEMSITLNGITYTDIDTTNTVDVPQPNKIDVFAIDFANPNPFDKIVLATVESILSADFNKDISVDEDDLLMLADDWLDSEVQFLQQPDTNGIDLSSFSEFTFQFFDGMIDDISMYDYALTNAEIVYLIGNSYVFEPATDLNNDNIINFKDYADFASQWLNSY